MNKGLKNILGAASLATSILANTAQAEQTGFSSYADENIHSDVSAQTINDVFSNARDFARCEGNKDFHVAIINDHTGVLFGQANIPSFPYEAVLETSNDFPHYSLSQHYNLIIRAASPVQFYSASTQPVIIPFELPIHTSFISVNINHQLGLDTPTLKCTIPRLD